MMTLSLRYISELLSIQDLCTNPLNLWKCGTTVTRGVTRLDIGLPPDLADYIYSLKITIVNKEYQTDTSQESHK